ncbi:MAG: hypothetical protein ACM3ZQ_10065, partial [Bacillota bacterium]
WRLRGSLCSGHDGYNQRETTVWGSAAPKGCGFWFDVLLLNVKGRCGTIAKLLAYILALRGPKGVDLLWR